MAEAATIRFDRPLSGIAFVVAGVTVFSIQDVIGAVLNTTLKSGSNQFRGSVWEFARTDALNATDFFANRAGLKKPEYKSNQFGMTLGGPIRTGKTFFFTDYEGSLIKQGRTWVTTVPTAAQRNRGFPDFSDLIALQRGNVPGQRGQREDLRRRS